MFGFNMFMQMLNGLFEEKKDQQCKLFLSTNVFPLIAHYLIRWLIIIQIKMLRTKLSGGIFLCQYTHVGNVPLYNTREVSLA